MFDTVYQTTVNMRWGRSPVASVLGVAMILLGIFGIVFSSVDLSTRSVTGQHPLKLRVEDGVIKFVPAYLSDYSMWATLGKGIWTGIFFIVTGIVAICSQRERTSKAIAATTILAALSAIFGLFLMLSAIAQIEFYNRVGGNSTIRRTNVQNTEYTMNALLLTTGLLAFIVGTLLACCGCCLDSCRDARSRMRVGPQIPRAFAPISAPYGPRVRPYPPGYRRM